MPRSTGDNPPKNALGLNNLLYTGEGVRNDDSDPRGCPRSHTPYCYTPCNNRDVRLVEVLSESRWMWLRSQTRGALGISGGWEDPHAVAFG